MVPAAAKNGSAEEPSGQVITVVTETNGNEALGAAQTTKNRESGRFARLKTFKPVVSSSTTGRKALREYGNRQQTKARPVRKRPRR